MKNFSIKLLCMLCVLFTYGSNLMADGFNYADWQGEMMPREYGKVVPFYLYSTKDKAFVCLNGNGPELILSETAEPMLFNAQNNMKNAQDEQRRNELIYSYACNGKTYYIRYVSGILSYFMGYYTTSKQSATSFNCNSSDPENEEQADVLKEYALSTNQGSNYCLTTKSDKLTFVQGSNDDYQHWYLISKKQYDNRQALAELIETIYKQEESINNDISTLEKTIEGLKSQIENASGEEKEKLEEKLKGAEDEKKTKESLKETLGSAEKAASGNSGEDIEAQYHALHEAYHTDQLLGELDRVLEVSEQMIEILQSRIGGMPSDFKNAYDNAKSLVSRGHSQEKPTSEQINAVKSILEAWNQVMTTEAFIYASEMKYLTQSSGYVVPVNTGSHTINGILKSIYEWISASEENKATKYEAVLNYLEGLRSDYFTWVYEQTTPNGNSEDGHGYPIGTDFTAYILNNSFELGNLTHWNATNATVIKEGTFDWTTATQADIHHAKFTGDGSLSQTLNTKLPTGKYRLSAELSGAILSITGDGVTIIKKENGGIEFDFVCKSSNAVTITITGSNGNTVDNVRLILIGGLAAQYVLADDCTRENSILDGTYEKVIVRRPLNASTNWNTICLPISLNEKETATYFSEVCQLTGLKKKEDCYSLVFTPASSIEAGLSYIVKANANGITDIVKENAPIEAAEPDYNSFITDEGKTAELTMYGTFKPFLEAGSIPRVDACTTYVLQQNQFKYLTSTNAVKMKGYRSFFIINIPTPTSANATALRLSFEEHEETAIEEIEMNDEDAVLYDLSGKRISKASRGMYIQNNKLIYLK